MSSSLSVSLAYGQVILVRYVESILFVLGIIGSLLNILLFSQRKLRVNSCCIYFLGSSISAIVFIFMGIIPQIYSLDHTPDPIFNRTFCKVRGYINQSSVMLCRWLLTMACIDRCLLTSTNAHLRLFSTVHNARKVIVLLCIIWLIFPVYILIFTDVRRSGYIACIISTSGSAFFHTIYSVIVGGIAPPFIMLICTRRIWKSLQLKKHRQRRITLNIQQIRRETRDIQVLIMLLLQVIIFITFTLPYMSFSLYLACTRLVIDKTVDRLAIESFMQLFTEITAFIYPALSFYSNTLASRTFRNELFDRLWWIFTFGGHGERFHNRQRIGPSTITATMTKRNDLPIVVVN